MCAHYPKITTSFVFDIYLGYAYKGSVNQKIALCSLLHFYSQSLYWGHVSNQLCSQLIMHHVLSVVLGHIWGA